ncbi:11090_t:CDS:1 [Paraglomus brasilianum]|uniref:11090_t:CDS:1 n=1 Tax=Paraglomus brasilianum TaxID=144538 RepID=A0A9N9GD11_9GLOM|nr:11090_t:CDS:1 [Paraglomus brasilianum]
MTHSHKGIQHTNYKLKRRKAIRKKALPKSGAQPQYKHSQTVKDRTRKEHTWTKRSSCFISTSKVLSIIHNFRFVHKSSLSCAKKPRGCFWKNCSRAKHGSVVEDSESQNEIRIMDENQIEDNFPSRSINKNYSKIEPTDESWEVSATLTRRSSSIRRYTGQRVRRTSRKRSRRRLAKIREKTRNNIVSDSLQCEETMNVTLRYWKSPVLHSDGSLRCCTQKRSTVRSIHMNNNYIVDLLFIDYIFFINNNDTNYEEFAQISLAWWRNALNPLDIMELLVI